MKNSLCLLIFSILSLIVSAQTQTDLLDGFKNFKIGGDFSKLKDSCVQNIPSDPNSIWKYNGKCCQTIAERKVTYIEFSIKDNKIETIYVTVLLHTSLENVHQDKWAPEWQTMCQYFASYLGEPDTDKNYDTEDATITMVGWAGKKANMYCAYNYLGLLKGDFIQIIFTSPSSGTKDF
mgnify:CR=1 FL=1